MCPQRVLQALDQGREAFAAERDVSLFEAGKGSRKWQSR